MKPGKSHVFDIHTLAAHPSLPAVNSGTWCLPSGRALVEFALSAGFAAPRVWLGMAPRNEEGRHPAAQGPSIDLPPSRRRENREYCASAAVEER